MNDTEKRIKIANLNELTANIQVYDFGDGVTEYSIILAVPEVFNDKNFIEGLPFSDESAQFSGKETPTGGDDNAYIEICGENDIKLAASLGIKTELIDAIYPKVSELVCEASDYAQTHPAPEEM